MRQLVCNKCGRVIEDEGNCDFSVHSLIGYGSSHDTEQLDIDLCRDCMDELIAWLSPSCKYPILCNGPEWI